MQCRNRQQINRRTNPRPTPSHLPPLSKGGGLTARHKPLYCCFLLVPHPPFLFTKPFYRQDGGIASPLRFAPHSYRPLSKVRCCRPKKFVRLPEGLPHQPSPRTNPSKNRTIPFAFRKGASLLLPLHRILPFPQQLQKDNNPSKIAITLASLVKGRWIDGKAQTVALLRFNCISTPFLSPNLFAVKTEGLLAPLRFAPHSYRPLSKVRCCRPKKFGRLPEGLSHLPYPFRFSDTSVNNLSFHTQPSQNRTIPRKSPTPLPCIAPSPLPPLEKGEVA